MKKLLFAGEGTGRVEGDLGLLLVRVGFGVYMVLHGMQKFPPTPQFIEGVGKMGLPAPELMAWLASISEVFGGALFAVGLLTRPAALAMVSTMAVAAFVAHGNDPWFSAGGRSKEMAVLFLVAAAGVGLIGAGRFSLDALAGGSGKKSR